MAAEDLRPSNALTELLRSHHAALVHVYCDLFAIVKALPIHLPSFSSLRLLRLTIENDATNYNVRPFILRSATPTSRPGICT